MTNILMFLQSSDIYFTIELVIKRQLKLGFKRFIYRISLQKNVIFRFLANAEYFKSDKHAAKCINKNSARISLSNHFETILIINVMLGETNSQPKKLFATQSLKDVIFQEQLFYIIYVIAENSFPNDDIIFCSIIYLPIYE